MYRTLPLFPLQLVAFPGEKLNLHIFEKRYRDLVNDCYQAGQTFGIPPIEEGETMDIGTEMKIVEIAKKYDDGRLDIKTLGLGTFRIIDFKEKLEAKSYAGGTVEDFSQDYETDLVLLNEVLKQVEQLYSIMKINKEVPELSSKFRIFNIAHKIGLNFNQEMTLLKMTSEVERLHYIKMHLSQLIPMVKEMEALRTKIQMNGHFKNVIPPDFKV